MACLVSKAINKAIPKMSLTRLTVPGERLYIDISGVKGKSRGVNKFWLLILDEATPKKWSFFLKAKSDQYEVIMSFLKNLKRKNIPVRVLDFLDRVNLRLDNSGEN